MPAKACIIYGCMTIQGIREVEQSGNFYCPTHYPKTARGVPPSKAPTKESMRIQKTGSS